jgi:hypothetical protein
MDFERTGNCVGDLRWFAQPGKRNNRHAVRKMLGGALSGSKDEASLANATRAQHGDEPLSGIKQETAEDRYLGTTTNERGLCAGKPN